MYKLHNSHFVIWGIFGCVYSVVSFSLALTAIARWQNTGGNSFQLVQELAALVGAAATLELAAEGPSVTSTAVWVHATAVATFAVASSFALWASVSIPVAKIVPMIIVPGRSHRRGISVAIAIWFRFLYVYIYIYKNTKYTKYIKITKYTNITKYELWNLYKIQNKNLICWFLF